MFLDTAPPVPRADIPGGVAALFEAEPDHASHSPRRVVAVLTTQDAAREARLLAPALRACRALGDELAVFLLPTGGESSFEDARERVRPMLDFECIEPVPPPRPPVARGPAQGEMRHAYRLYEFLKARSPDVVISTQAFGAPCFAIQARETGVCFRCTRFVIVAVPFEMQRRLNERLVTSRPYALIRFHLERAVAEGADLCTAPSHRFVENAIRTGAAAPASRFAVLPEVEVAGARDPAPERPAGFIIPDVPPLERNVVLFAAVAKRRPDALRNAEGRIRLWVDAAGRHREIAALCRERFAGTEVAWTVVGRGEHTDAGDALLFAPYCDDFFALGDALAPVVRGAPVLIGTGAAVGEPFEATGLAVAPFPDAVAEAITGATEGRRALRIAARPADLERSWIRFLGNLAPPERAEVPGAPRVSVCLMHFNRPKLVEAALSSALGQTYEHTEVLIFDDGSDAPGAIEALAALAETHRVRLVRQDNRYRAAAGNGAARAAGGEYVYFLDDDNVLKPHAIETLVHAARTSGADFVGSFSDIFTGDGAPDPGTVAVRRILQTGGDTGFSLFNNAILDGNALCRRDAFLELGGNTEDYGIGKEDQEFFARAIRSGRNVAIVPEALFWARHGQRGIKSMHVSRNAGHFRVLEAYWPVVDPEYRGLLLLLQGMFIERFEAPASKPEPMPGRREASVPALGVEPPRFGVDRLKRGRAVTALSACARWSVQRVRDALLSVPDAAVGRRGRRVIGAVESRPWPEVRGWALDPGDPGRSRRVAIHVDGRLCKVVGAEERRADVARWQGTEGRHGFRWRIPEGVAVKDGTRIEVFDADTGRRLRGSPLRIEGGRAVASTRYRT